MPSSVEKRQARKLQAAQDMPYAEALRRVRNVKPISNDLPLTGIFGWPGSGKTYLALRLAVRRFLAGERVVVLQQPHAHDPTEALAQLARSRTVVPTRTVNFDDGQQHIDLDQLVVARATTAEAVRNAHASLAAAGGGHLLVDNGVMTDSLDPFADLWRTARSQRITHTWVHHGVPPLMFLGHADAVYIGRAANAFFAPFNRKAGLDPTRYCAHDLGIQRDGSGAVMVRFQQLHADRVFVPSSAHADIEEVACPQHPTPESGPERRAEGVSRTGRSPLTAIIGTPGAGKSTLARSIAYHARANTPVFVFSPKVAFEPADRQLIDACRTNQVPLMQTHINDVDHPSELMNATGNRVVLITNPNGWNFDGTSARNFAKLYRDVTDLLAHTHGGGTIIFDSIFPTLERESDLMMDQLAPKTSQLVHHHWALNHINQVPDLERFDEALSEVFLAYTREPGQRDSWFGHTTPRTDTLDRNEWDGFEMWRMTDAGPGKVHALQAGVDVPWKPAES